MSAIVPLPSNEMTSEADSKKKQQHPHPHAPAPDIPTDHNAIKTNAQKSDDDFRIYSEDTTPPRVIRHYRDMRTHQTVEFYRRMEHKYTFENGAYRRSMTIEEAFDELEQYVDSSDPDLDLPNLVHLLQTAEGIRHGGHPDWMQLVGLVHDMGKIMFLWGTNEDGQDGTSCDGKQWALGGDTWVVGCQIPDGDAVVFPEFNRLNPDMNDSRYNTKYGMYEPHCGLDRLMFAWGHDEYMYRMLVSLCVCFVFNFYPSANFCAPFLGIFMFLFPLTLFLILCRPLTPTQTIAPL
mmetsp:Transcript_39226/g.117958  ORF Transcript_39226/g.117958 Transcript_39226/m.117958 type:complete len:292 (-) Transcript_39226:597-1472(-)